MIRWNRFDVGLAGFGAIAICALATLRADAAEPETAPPPAPAPTAPQANPVAPAPPAGEQGKGEAKKEAAPAGEDRTGMEVVAVLTGGQRVRGVLVHEEADHIVLRIANVDTTVPRDQIERIITQRPAVERYHEMRAVIDDHDVDRLLLLIEWLRSQSLLDEARIEIDHVLTIEPQNGEALKLSKLIEHQMELRSKMKSPTAPDPERAAAPSVRRPTPAEFPLLTPDQVNLMKVYEIDIEHPPRLVIDRDVVKDLMNEYSDSPLIPQTRDGRTAFARKPAADILATMFDLRARSLYGRVRVMGLPDSMRQFRDRVNSTWLVNSCATTRCHGGEAAGRLLLTNRSPSSETASFTNFLILDRFRLADGSAVIDWASPERSPLLQMGLPRGDSVKPHPEVEGWAPMFRSRDDQRFQQAIDWIKAMHRPRPDYPVQYEAPKALRPVEPERPETPEAPRAPNGPDR